MASPKADERYSKELSKGENSNDEDKKENDNDNNDTNTADTNGENDETELNDNIKEERQEKIEEEDGNNNKKSRSTKFTVEKVKKWAINIGPLCIDKTGMKLKPQFKITVENGWFNIGGGIGDIRDGIDIGVGGKIKKTYYCQGKTYYECLNNLKTETHIIIIDNIIQLIANLQCKIYENYKIDIKYPLYCECILVVKTSIEINAGLWLGWCDTKGYNMIGVSGDLAAAVDVGFDLRMGINNREKKLKIVTGLSNIVVDLVIHYSDPHDNDTITNNNMNLDLGSVSLSNISKVINNDTNI